MVGLALLPPGVLHPLILELVSRGGPLPLFVPLVYAVLKGVARPPSVDGMLGLHFVKVALSWLS